MIAATEEKVDWFLGFSPDLGGSGNVSYFDDIIAAGKKEEVEAFLGIGDGSSGRQVK